MKKLFFSFMIVFFSFSTAYARTFTQPTLFDQKGNIRAEVLEIFWLFRKAFAPSTDKPHDNVQKSFPDQLSQLKNPEINGSFTVETLNKIAQTFFLRPKGEERLSELSKHQYHTLCKFISPAEKNRIIALFRTLGNIDAIDPQRKNPDYILIQGGTVYSIRDRLMFVVEEWRQGRLDISASPKIVFLSGERPLFSSETADILINPSPYQVNSSWKPPAQLPTDESELCQFVWNQLDLPQELRHLDVQFITAEKKAGTARATTEDAAKKWLNELVKEEGHCWVVSNNPYIEYQQKVMEYTAQKYQPERHLVFEGIGKEASFSHGAEEISVGLLLDNLARTLYILDQMEKLNAGR